MELYKLKNKVQQYAWGSPDWIPKLLGESNPRKEPWAELWMGIHPAAPSETEYRGVSVPLNTVPARGAADIPFLLKFLAAEKPLSIQAHPSLEQARAGFERENRAGIPLSSPERNYRDPNHKPEILCALSPFTAMAGFRSLEETESLLGVFFGKNTNLEGIQKKLMRALTGGGYRPFLSALFNLEKNEINTISVHAQRFQNARNEDDGFSLALRLCSHFAEAYPEDPGILSPLYLNVFRLVPPEAIFIPSGTLHAYIKGFGVECMANSDNVLRGGLTPKHVDLPELLGILDFEPRQPEPLVPVEVFSSCYRYKTNCDEFSLSMIKGPEGILRETGAVIIAVTQGSLKGKLTGRTPELSGFTLKQGESAFIPPRQTGEDILVRGNFVLFAAVDPRSP